MRVCVRVTRSGDGATHASKLFHGGGLVTRGSRFVLVGFAQYVELLQLPPSRPRTAPSSSSSIHSFIHSFSFFLWPGVETRYTTPLSRFETAVSSIADHIAVSLPALHAYLSELQANGLTETIYFVMIGFLSLVAAIVIAWAFLARPATTAGRRNPPDSQQPKLKQQQQPPQRPN